MKKFSVTLVFLILAGCGASKEEKMAACQATDWWAVGYEDGINGQYADRFKAHREACAKYGVMANITLYLEGRDEGLREYCRPQNGYSLGVSGYKRNNVCPPDLEPDFVDAHSEGFGLYQRRMTVQRAVDRRNEARRRADNLELIIADRSAAMISPSTPLADRIEIGIEVKQLTQEMVDLEQSMPGLEADIEQAERELDEYRRDMSARYSS
jgi:hypothetical protein